MKFIIRIIWLLLFLIIPFTSAHAHRPYLIKQGTINDTNGNKIITEKLYGDGIFAADPVTFQLRHKNGAFLANSPVGDRVASFCPTIKFCWAFPYSAISPFATGWKFDFENVSSDLTVPNYDLKGEEAEIFKKYLEDDAQKRAYSYVFGYPEMSKSHSGFKPSTISILLSPAAIILDQLPQLLAVIALTVIFVFLYALFFQRKHIEKKLLRHLNMLIGVLVLIGYFGFFIITNFIIAFTLSAPWLYMLSAILAGGLLTKYGRKKFSQFRNKKA